MFHTNRTSSLESASFLTFLQSLQTRAANVVNLLQPCTRHRDHKDPWHDKPHLHNQCVDLAAQLAKQQLDRRDENASSSSSSSSLSEFDLMDAVVARYQVTLERLSLANAQLVALFEESSDFQSISSATEVATLRDAIFTPMQPWFNPQMVTSNLGVRRPFELEEEELRQETEFQATRDQLVTEYTEVTNHNANELGDFAVDEDVLASDLQDSIAKYNFAIHELTKRWRSFNELQKARRADHAERKSMADARMKEQRVIAQERREVVLKRALKVMQKGAFL